MQLFDEIVYLTEKLPQIGKPERKQVKKFLGNILLALQKKICVTLAYTNKNACVRNRKQETQSKQYLYVKSFFYRLEDKSLILYARIRGIDTTITVKKTGNSLYEYYTDNGKTIHENVQKLLTSFFNYWYNSEAMPRPV